jgi:hypothetical protein
VLRELLRTPHSLIVVDEESRIIRRARTSERFTSLDAVIAEFEAIASTLEVVDRGAHAMLIDLRLAPPRNDDPYEEVAQRYSPRLYGGFRRVAVLVQTAAGRLQLRRFLDLIRPDAGVFSVEREARVFLGAR